MHCYAPRSRASHAGLIERLLKDTSDDKSLVTAPLVVCMGFALAFPGNVCSAIAEDSGLLADIPAPPGSKSLGTEAGRQASYSTSANPGAVIDSYKQALPEA